MDLHPFLLMLTAVVHFTNTAKILLLPVHHKGHVNFFTVAARELQNRGYEVVVLVEQRNKHIVEQSNVPYILNSGKVESPAENPSGAGMFNSGLSQFYALVNFVTKMMEVGLELCYQAIQNDAIVQDLQHHKFDLALVDGFDVGRCLYVIPYKLDIPYITLTARQDPWVAGLPAVPSVEGFFGLAIVKKDSGYLQVFKNLAIYLITYVLSPPPVFKDWQIKDLAPEKPDTTYVELFKASEVFLINFDNTCLDYPRVQGPHYHFIGGMAASPAKPLPKEFDDFVRGASDGLIVVSFGSFLKQVPMELLDKMLAAFRKIPQRVVMRYDGQVGHFL